MVVYKTEVYQEITFIDTSAKEQVWFQDFTVTGMNLGGAYVPPVSSTAAFVEILRLLLEAMWWKEI